VREWEGGEEKAGPLLPSRSRALSSGSLLEKIFSRKHFAKGRIEFGRKLLE